MRRDASTGTTSAKPRSRRERPLKRTRSQNVTDALRERILSGIYPPGSHLQEELLANEVGTSRTPVRAALLALAQESLLVYFPNRGYQVPSFTLDDIVKAYEVRAALEGTAVRLLAESGLDEETSRKLAHSLQSVDAVLAKGRLLLSDQALWRGMNVVFHETIRQATHNRLLIETLETITNIPMVSNSIVQWYDFALVKNYHADHRAIYEAMISHQGTRAEALMREHVYKAREFISKSFSDLVRRLGSNPANSGE
jgi:GntR family transcriptional regulator of vanillate catabolism